MRLTRIFRTTGFRLAALYAALFGASVVVLLAVSYWLVSDALRQQLATNIQGEVAAIIEAHRSGGVPVAAKAIERRLASRLHRTTFYLLRDPAGRKVAGNLPDRPGRDGWQEIPPPAGSDDRSDDGDSDRYDGVGEQSLLALGATLSDRSFLMVGEDAYPIVEVEEAIVQTFGWAFTVTVLLGALGGTALSFGFLLRVDAINRTMRTIIGGRFSDRVPVRGANDELDRIAINLNEMLDRVQTLMESLRQVSSDIAHDLRTPLSRLRQQLEAARFEARSLEDYEAAVDAAIGDADAILALFAALLRIAQIEAGTRKSAFADVDLSALFQSIADTYEVVAEERGQVLTATIAPGIQVRGDRELLMQMLANLVENAIRHAPAGTHIRIALERGGPGPISVVADDGPGIPVEARAKVFRRFFRLERSRSTPGSGLGLALVAAVADLHGIAVTLIDNEPGLKVVLQFAPEQRS